MTGREVFIRALKTLNYVDPGGSVSARQNGELFKRAEQSINHILADVQHVAGAEFHPITDLNADISVSDEVAIRVMVPGVAMLIAMSESDGDSQQLYCELYNQARGTVPRNSEQRKDVLPRVFL